MAVFVDFRNGEIKDRSLQALNHLRGKLGATSSSTQLPRTRAHLFLSHLIVLPPPQESKSLGALQSCWKLKALVVLVLIHLLWCSQAQSPLLSGPFKSGFASPIALGAHSFNNFFLKNVF